MLSIHRVPHLFSKPKPRRYHQSHQILNDRARIASAWHDRVRKAEEEYLAAAAATTTATSQPQAVGVKPRLQGRRSPSRGAVSTIRGGASLRKHATGGQGGRADTHDSDGGGDGDADALACIGKTLENYYQVQTYTYIYIYV